MLCTSNVLKVEPTETGCLLIESDIPACRPTYTRFYLLGA